MDVPPLRILIVDDSALYRQTIHNVLRTVPGVTIVGTARNGQEALGKIGELDPDLLTLDVQMPDMDGIQLLREIKKRGLRPKALMVSQFTANGAQVTTDALMEGAFDFILKPSGDEPAGNRQRLRDGLEDKITVFRQTVQNQRRRTLRARPQPPPVSLDELAEDAPTPESVCPAVLIGASTGGPAALKVVLPKLPAEFPVPVLVVQHMPAHFTRSLARRLDESCPLEVLEATEGREVHSGTVLVAPGGRQMNLVRRDDRIQVHLTDDPPENGCRPAIDYLFRSVPQAFGDGVLAVIMTGMGKDGVKGCHGLKRRGCHVFVQDEDTSVVYGMPKAVWEEGLADRVLPLGKIGPAILRHVKRSRRG